MEFFYLAWPFTILKNDNITISWDFLRLTAPAALPVHLGAVCLKKSHDTVILSFCNIVKGQAKYEENLLMPSRRSVLNQENAKNDWTPNDKNISMYLFTTYL